MYTVETDIEFAIRLAISGRKYLVEKWRGKYGDGYPKDIRDNQINEYNDDIARLREIRRTL